MVEQARDLSWVKTGLMMLVESEKVTNGESLQGQDAWTSDDCRYNMMLSDVRILLQSDEYA